MAPVNQRASFKGKKVKNYSEKGQPSAVTQKTKKWSPGNKYFDGSLQQGQGFAFKRKQKIKQEYNKLLRKEKWRMRGTKTHVTEEYPEHLRHLYIAEQQKLDEEAQMNRIRRKKGRTAEADEEETGTRELDVARSSSATQAAACSETSTLTGSSNKQDSQRSHKDQRQRNQKKISSYQKMKQDYERIKEERERKRQEYLKDKAQRDEALKKYKEKKMATYQLLKKKTKKGQPNLNLQMELLLQKIQAQRR